MVYFGGSIMARRRLSRYSFAMAYWWPFVLDVRGSSTKIERNNTIGGPNR
jgi:hypothetical protein